MPGFSRARASAILVFNSSSCNVCPWSRARSIADFFLKDVWGAATGSSIGGLYRPLLLLSLLLWPSTLLAQQGAPWEPLQLPVPFPADDPNPSIVIACDRPGPEIVAADGPFATAAAGKRVLFVDETFLYDPLVREMKRMSAGTGNRRSAVLPR